MMKIKRQKAKWSALLTSAAMLMINIPVAAEETQSLYTNGITTTNGYMEFEQPQLTENQDMTQLGYSDIRAYQITNAGELAWFVQHFYAGDLETQNVSLADNINMSDLSAYSWTPIGYYDSTTQSGVSYNGVFDGNGYSISGIAMDQIAGQDLVSSVSAAQAEATGVSGTENLTQNALAAVFGYIGTSGYVTELKLENTSIASNNNAAVLAGRNEGTIAACITANSTVTSSMSNAFVSEFAADNENVIQSVYSTGLNISNLLSDDQVTPILLNYAPGYSSATGAGSASALYTETKESVDGSLFVTDAPAGVTVLDSSQFADGAVAWSLNANFSEPKFSQFLGSDSTPEFKESDGSVARVYKWTLDYADEAAEDGVAYTNGTVLDSLFADGREWQMAGADGNLVDVTSGMTIESDATLIEKTAEPSTEVETTTASGEETTQESVPETIQQTPETDTIQKVDPAYTKPEGLSGFVTHPLSEITLPSDLNGHFEWETDPATILPAGQETANALVRFVPNDTDTYNTITGIVVTITINKLDPTPAEACPQTISLDEGQTLSTVSLPTGWRWLDGNIVPENGVYTAVYTPDDTSVYNTVNASVQVTVNPTKPADTTPPEITGIEDGKTYCEAQTVTVTDESAFTVTVNGQPVTLDENGSFTLEPGEGQLSISAVDEFENMTTVNVIVNNGHTFSDGKCVICGAEDPDYVPEPTEDTSIPSISMEAKNEDGTKADGQGNDGWYRTKYITLTAPDGYNIVENLYERSRRMPMMDVELTEGENQIVYYLVKDDNTTVSEQRTLTLYLDTTVPQENGIEEGKVYCAPVTFTIVEENLDRTNCVFPESVTENADGSFTAAPADGEQTMILRDKAGNETTVHYTVNDGHTFENGKCIYCGEADPNYKEPATESDSVADAVATTPDADGNWYRTNTITLTAPTGYYISQTGDEDNFGTETSLSITLQEGQNDISYYLLSTDGKIISTLKTYTASFDATAPTISGVEEGKTYCEAPTLTISDANLTQVTVNGTVVSLTPEGTLTVAPASEPQTIKAVDAAGNETSVTITVNNGHSYANGICTVCGQYDPNYSVNVDAQFLTQGMGSNGWYRQDATLKAPDGFYIAFTNDRANFGANTQIVITEEGSYTMNYYLMNSSTGAISQQKQISIKLDKTVPVISGAESNKTYCLDQKLTLTVADTNLFSVKLNNQEIASANTLQTAGSFSYEITKAGAYVFTAADAAGNLATVRFTVNENHIWDAGVIQAEPTITTTGTKLYTCTVCGATKTEELPMVTTEATTETPTTPEPTTTQAPTTTETPTTTTQEATTSTTAAETTTQPSTAPSTAPSSSETQPSTAPSTTPSSSVSQSTAPSNASSSAAEASSSTLAMPTTQSSQINQILGINDPSSIIGIILVVIGIILAAAVIAMIILAKKSRK